MGVHLNIAMCCVALFGYETSQVLASCKSNNIIRDVVIQCDGNILKVYNNDRLILRAAWALFIILQLW